MTHDLRNNLTQLFAQVHERSEFDLFDLVYDWFTEGIDTADLKDARALSADRK